MGMIENDWLQAVGGEFRKPYYKELYEFVKQEYSTRAVSYTHLDVYKRQSQQ